MKDVYQIADRMIEIESLYQEVHDLCRDYRFCGTPDFRIRIMPQDITYERERSAREDIKEGKPVHQWPESYLETLAVYRKIADCLTDEDILLFHGSVIAVDGQAYLFTAKSGTGKSTHTRLWREHFGDRAVMVNDDKPLLRITEQEVIAYGTPWNGKHHLGENIAVPLKAICILQRGEENHIVPVTKQQVYAMLIQQVHKPASPAKLATTLRLIDRLTEHVSLYQLQCNRNPDAVTVSYNAMKG